MDRTSSTTPNEARGAAPPVHVSAEGDDEYLVRVGDRTEHAVRAVPEVLARVARSGESPAQTVARSFEFLLQRESAESILRSFRLEEIGRYFPEFWSVMTTTATPATSPD